MIFAFSYYLLDSIFEVKNIYFSKQSTKYVTPIQRQTSLIDISKSKLRSSDFPVNATPIWKYVIIKQGSYYDLSFVPRKHKSRPGRRARKYTQKQVESLLLLRSPVSFCGINLVRKMQLVQGSPCAMYPIVNKRPLFLWFWRALLANHSHVYKNS